MKLYQLELARRSIEGLSMTQAPSPRPGPSEVLIRMHAFSLNFRDLVVVEGGYGARQKKQNLLTRP